MRCLLRFSIRAVKHTLGMVHRVILLAHLHQRIDVAQLLTQRFVGLLLDHLYCLRQVYLSECYVVAVVLDDGYFGHS